MTSLFSASRLTRNSILSLSSQCFPILVGIVTLPILIGKLGVDRFGILSLSWIFIGYLSIFDFGLGRSITKLVADLAHTGDTKGIREIVWTGLAAMLGVGTLIGLLVFLLGPFIVYRIVNIPPQFQHDALMCIRILGCSIPAVLLAVGAIGVLEARQHFLQVAIIRLPSGVWTYVGPLISLYISNSLILAVAYLAAGRYVSTLAYLVALISDIDRPSISALRADAARRVIGFGGWLAVGNLAGSLMVYLDRFFIAALLPVATLAFYATPHQILTRLLIVPTALLSVFFPAFASSFSQSRPIASRVYLKALLGVLILLLPPVAAVYIFSNQLINFWIDADFASASAEVTRLLSIMVFVHAFGIISQAFVQATGRPDIAGKFGLIELPVFAGYLYILIERYGIVGAAYAGIIRVAISTVVLSLFAVRQLREVKGSGATILSN